MGPSKPRPFRILVQAKWHSMRCFHFCGFETPLDWQLCIGTAKDTRAESFLLFNRCYWKALTVEICASFRPSWQAFWDSVFTHFTLSSHSLSMSVRRFSGVMESSGSVEPRELFEACRSGDLERVKKLVCPVNVNSRDTAGRRSTPLHFAAGESHSPSYSVLFVLFPRF